MTNPTWASTGLPDHVLQDGYEEMEPETAVRSQMETGPAKLRQRFTSGRRRIKCVMSLSGTEVDTLGTFFSTTLVGGTQPFDWVLPRTQAATTFRFVDRPNYSLEAGDRYYANFSLEVMP